MPFLPVLNNGFVDLDDFDNIVGNPWIRSLALPNLHWMVTTFQLGHWQPLTWLSLALDFRLYGGIVPRGFHATSLLLHAGNTGLLALLGERLLGRAGMGRCDRQLGAIIGALLWGIHPLRVESVAWATERRDVLSGFFLLLTVLLYVPRPGRTPRLGWALVATAGALLSKASGMVLPLLLLLLDAYPLRRLGRENGRLSRRPYLEKAPFFGLCAASAVVAIAASRASGALQSLSEVAIGQRAGAAMLQAGFYLWKTVWPVDLLPLYEYPPELGPAHPAALAGLATLVAAGVGAWMLRRRVPGIGTALVAYLLALAPTMGFAQSGPQVAADRYSYVAMMGGAIVLGGLTVAGTRHSWRRLLAIAPLIVVLATLTWRQSGTWHDARTMWTRVITLVPDHAYGHKSLGDAARLAGDLSGAEAAYRRSLALRPLPEAHTNLASTLAASRRFEEAFAEYRIALALKPDYAFAWTSYGVALDDAGFRDDALTAHGRALSLDPDLMEAHVNLGSLLDDLGRPEEAMREYERARAIAPSPEVYNNIGALLIKLGRPAEAVTAFREGVTLRPDVAVLQENLGLALRAIGQRAQAIEALSEALRLDPQLSSSRTALTELGATP